MSIPRNLGNFADNVNTNGKVEVTGINATGTPSASTALLGNGTWGTVATSPAGSNTQVQYNNAGAFGASSALTFDGATVSSPIVQSTNGTITTVLSYSGGNSTGIVGTTSNHSVEFRQNNTEGMRLTSTGLGIGTSSPASKLHIVGANTANRGQLSVQSDSAGNEARISLYDGTDNIGEFGTSGTSVYAYSGGNLLLYAGGTQRFVVGSSGQLGIGTSPSYGTSGQVLTSAGSGAAPTWATPSSGSMVLLASVNAVNAATVDFTSFIDSTVYEAYQIVLGPCWIDSNSIFYCRIKKSGSFQTSGYQYDSNRINGSGDRCYLSGANMAAGSYAFGFTVTLFNDGYPTVSKPQSTWQWQGSYVNPSTGAITYVTGSGMHWGTNADTEGIQFFTSSGSIWGAFRLYGIKKS